MTKSKAETLVEGLEITSRAFNDELSIYKEAAAHLRAQDALIGELVEALKKITKHEVYDEQVMAAIAREALDKAEAAR